MASTDEFRNWAQGHQYRLIAAELLRLEQGRGSFDYEDLADDPEAALHGNSEVTVEYDTHPRAGCSVYGYYRPNLNGQSLIFIHPSLTNERDNFTILHELGHHVQRQHLAWAEIRYQIAGIAGEALEERVADAFAAEILIPTSAVASGEGWLNARTLREVYSNVRASRAAVAMRAIEISPAEEQATVLVTDDKGMVLFARASGDEVFAPARGCIQPGVAELILRASEGEGHLSGELSWGLQARSGWEQQALTAEVALDHTWSYAFVVIRPSQKFGRSPQWSRREDQECSRAACGTIFSVDETISICSTCKSSECPECRSCACDLAVGEACGKCFTTFSAAERATPDIHECMF